MPTREVTIINKLGLHARAAAKFVALAGRFDSVVQVHREGKTVNGKSIMGMMMLAAGRGTTIVLDAEGDDADDALDALEGLVNERFQEAE
ncbi:HPr family phosphocarrier protein [Aquisalimonas lutea]|uniref:HPr family phosphocarrier protein n=1 Tax=Aquisalimonas lutea TaxID=1327750 RepID=UPI0025B3961D|nr:HPr family phosphocarrier protein [Aquisalimonas lutea]MDN3517370.1 HPr family phosphocarrier protein [Aquisalimonas lutea]